MCVYKKMYTNIICLCLIILLANNICTHIVHFFVHTLTFDVCLIHVRYVLHTWISHQIQVCTKKCVQISFVFVLLFYWLMIFVHTLYTLTFGVRPMHVKRVMHGISLTPNVNVCTICIQKTHLYFICFFLYIKREREREREIQVEWIWQQKYSSIQPNISLFKFYTTKCIFKNTRF
jgi:hypothetical protein